MLMFHGSDVLPNFETIHIRANSQGYDAYRPTPETVAIFFHDSPKNHDLYAIHDEVCVACKGGPSQIPPSFQNPLGTCCSTQGRSWTAWNAREKLVGRGTVERPWFFFEIFQGTGPISLGENRVFMKKLREFGFWNGVAGQTNSWSLETIPLSLDSSKALPKKKVSKTSETWKFWGSLLDLLKREWFEAFPSMRNNGNPANQSCWLCL